MVSITLYNALDNKSVRALTDAREIALRTNKGLVDGEHLLYVISVIGDMGAIPITNALMVASGLTKTAIRNLIGVESAITSDAHGRFSPFVERVWETAADAATRHGSSNITLTHALYGVLHQAQRYPRSRTAKFIFKITPHLDLGQMLRSIDDLLGGGTDRTARIVALGDEIAKRTLALRIAKTTCSTHKYLSAHE
jgi:ATP-dependent Clp protease ATP-binding subunit ClpA